MEAKQCSKLQVYCEMSTCMGVADLYRETNQIGKTFWAILILTGLSVTVWQTYGTFKQFVNDPVYETTLSKVFDESVLRFPNITICNYNRIKQSLRNKTKIDPMVLIYLFQLFPATYDYPLSHLGPSIISNYQEAWDSYMGANNGEIDIAKILRFYGHNRTETFIIALIDMIMYPLNNIVEIFTVYGRCWKVIPPSGFRPMAGISNQ